MSLVAKGNRLSDKYTDLAARRLGGQALSCSNDFFAEMENLLKNRYYYIKTIIRSKRSIRSKIVSYTKINPSQINRRSEIK